MCGCASMCQGLRGDINGLAGSMFLKLKTKVRFYKK